MLIIRSCQICQAQFNAEFEPERRQCKTCQPPNVLTLPLKKKYFDEIKAGTKKFEYRLHSEYWKKRIEGHDFTGIVFILGYPKAGDMTRRLEFPWNGYKVKSITHPQFGNKPEKVFAITIKR